MIKDDVPDLVQDRQSISTRTATSTIVDRLPHLNNTLIYKCPGFVFRHFGIRANDDSQPGQAAGTDKAFD
jgi:hypothetical protein